MSGNRLAISVVALLSFDLAPARLASPSQANQPDGAGRVVVTVTTLQGAIHLPGVEVDLRPAEETLAIAWSVTDGAGQVLFADIPPG